MNPSTLAQLKLERRLPPPVSESPQAHARSEWLYNAADDLLRGGDVKFQRRMCSPQGVKASEFALAVDEYVNNRLADGEVHTAALGYLLIAAKRRYVDMEAADQLLGRSDHPFGKLGEIAEGLLRPLVDDALIAMIEDDEL